MTYDFSAAVRRLTRRPAAIMTVLLSACVSGPPSSPAMRQSNNTCTLEAGANVQVSHHEPGVMIAESQIAVDPTDQRNLVASATTARLVNRILWYDAESYHSSDGGLTWQQGRVYPPGSVGNDTNVTFDRDGRAYYFSLAVIRPVPATGNGTRVFTSDDGGQRWRLATSNMDSFTTGLDRWQVTADVTTGAFGGAIYAFGLADGAVELWRTHNRGRSWQRNVVASRSDVSTAIQSGSSVPIFPNGDILLPFHTWPATSTDSQFIPNQWFLSIGTNGGAQISDPRLIPIVDDGHLALAVDQSDGRYSDRIYAAWADANAGGEPQIQFSSSQDRGVNWTPPKPIGPALTASGPGHIYSDWELNLGISDTEGVALAVDASGALLVTWDRFVTDGQVASYADALQHLRSQRYYAASFDGGATFSAPRPLASGASRYVRGRDYLNVAAGPSGTFNALWFDAPQQSSAQDLFFAPLHVRCAPRPKSATPRDGEPQ